MVNEQISMNIIISFQFVCGILAILFNWPILWVTIKHRNFQKSCGYLLAALALCDIVYGFGGLTPFVSMLFDWKVSLMTCFFIEVKTTFSIMCSYYFMFFLSIDRLIAVCAPLWYHRLADRSAWKYVATISIPTVCYSVFQLHFMYLVAAGNPEKKVLCQPGEYIQGFASSFGYTNYLVIAAVTTSIYLIVGIVIRVKKFDVQQNSNSIFKSLFILMLVSAGCSLFAISMAFVLPGLAMDEETKYLLGRLLNQYSRVYSVLDGPILYFCSTEYRRAFVAEFKVLRWLNYKCSSSSSTVAGGGITPAAVGGVLNRNTNNNTSNRTSRPVVMAQGSIRRGGGQQEQQRTLTQINNFIAR